MPTTTNAPKSANTIAFFLFSFLLPAINLSLKNNHERCSESLLVRVSVSDRCKFEEQSTRFLLHRNATFDFVLRLCDLSAGLGDGIYSPRALKRITSAKSL